MNVIVSPELPASRLICEKQRELTHALRNNSAAISVNNDSWEMVAILIPGTNSDDIQVDFGLRSISDGRVRLTVGATIDRATVSVDFILDSTEEYMDPDLFCVIATRAVIEANKMSLAGSSIHNIQ